MVTPRAQYVSLDNIKLRRVDRSQSMPVFDRRKQEEFQLVRNSIRSKTYTRRRSSIRETDELQSTPSESCSSLTSVTSTTEETDPARVGTSCRSSLWEVRRTKSLTTSNIYHSNSSRTSFSSNSVFSSNSGFEIPTLRSTKSCPSAREYLRELEQANDMLETCKEISSLTSDFTQEFKELTKASVEIPAVCLKLETYASDILVHLEGIKA